MKRKIVSIALFAFSAIGCATSSTALLNASKEGNTELVRISLNGFMTDVNARDEFGTTPLMLATRGGFTDVVSLLIEKKADVNAKTKEGFT
ncbi:MAG: ankyrin repeat domain-containing protein, partial [Leptospira sp.]|nr:ankyrin repeat domain-containing protein [Leptospira sp.]